MLGHWTSDNLKTKFDKKRNKIDRQLDTIDKSNPILIDSNLFVSGNSPHDVRLSEAGPVLQVPSDTGATGPPPNKQENNGTLRPLHQSKCIPLPTISTLSGQQVFNTISTISSRVEDFLGCSQQLNLTSVVNVGGRAARQSGTDRIGLDL